MRPRIGESMDARPLRVALVNPPVIAVIETWYDTPDFVRPALACLAGYLRCQGDYELLLIDAKFERLRFDDVIARLVEFQPDVVGVTAFTNEVKPAAYLASLVKERIPRSVTVIGGAHVTAIPAPTLREFPSFDIGVAGEGEVTLHELCEALRRGTELSDVAGLVIREDGQVRLTAARERTLDLDEFPLPAWDLMPRAEVYWIQTERGCPFHCQFCLNPNGRVARRRGVDNVLEEMEWVARAFQPKQFRFGDELFTVDIPRAHALMDALIERGVCEEIPWDCQTHVRFVNRDLLRKMKRAGCYHVDLGVETGDEEKLRTLGKGTTPDMIVAAGQAAREAGLRFSALLIIGHPNETAQSVRKTAELAAKFNPTHPTVGIMTPYPGTAISWMAARGEGGYRLFTNDWDYYNKHVTVVLSFANLSPTKILLCQIMMYTRVMTANGRWLELLKMAWRYRSGVLSMLAELLIRRDPVRTSPLRPRDYDERLSKGIPCTPQDLIEAYGDWEQTQQQELVRTRREAGELLRIVTIDRLVTPDRSPTGVR